MSGRHNQEGGFTLIEVLVAVTIMALAVFGVSLIMSSVSLKSTGALMRDRAEQLADDVLERAQAFGCGLDVGTEASAPGNLYANRETNCFSAANFADFDSSNYPPAAGFVVGGQPDGDSTWTTMVGGYHYTVRFETSWQQVDQPDNCPGLGAGAGESDPAGADGIDQTVVVGWLDYRTPMTWTVSDFEAVPPDATTYHDLSRGAVLFQFAQGEDLPNGPALITLTVRPEIGAPEVVSRYEDSNGCAFFPFLPPSHGALGSEGVTNSSANGSTSPVVDASYSYTKTEAVGQPAPGGGALVVAPSAGTTVSEG